MDLDDITTDLMSVINKQPNTTEYIIGGDFNIKPESHNFDELNELLSHHGISLMSDQSQVTYFGTNGVSCVDHIYGSHSIETANTTVLVSGISDHEPISATVYVPRSIVKRNSNAIKGQEFKPDIDKIRLSIENEANTALDVTDPLELAKNIQSEFKSNMVVKKKKTQGTKPWYNSYLHDLRKIMMDSMYMFKTGKIEHNSYTLARNAYHKALHATQFNYNQKWLMI